MKNLLSRLEAMPPEEIEKTIDDYVLALSKAERKNLKITPAVVKKAKAIALKKPTK